jgi:hypothetical protein
MPPKPPTQPAALFGFAAGLPFSGEIPFIFGPLPAPPTLNYSGALNGMASLKERNLVWNKADYARVCRQVGAGLGIALNVTRQKEPELKKRAGYLKLSKDWLKATTTGDFSLFGWPDECAEEANKEMRLPLGADALAKRCPPPPGLEASMHLSIFRWSFQIMHLLIFDAMDRFPLDLEAGSHEACFRIVELVVVIISDLLRSEPVRKRMARDAELLLHILKFSFWSEQKTRRHEGRALSAQVLVDEADTSQAIDFIIQAIMFDSPRA